MTQAELDEILMNHHIWISTQGQEGEKANFDSKWVSEKYEISSQSMWVEFHENGGVAAFGEQPFQAGEPVASCVVSHFSKLSFGKADLTAANFGDAIFYECDMTGVNFSCCDLSNSKFAKVNFKGANFSFCEPKVIFSGGVFVGCDFERCFLQHVNFDNCNLSGSNFSGCSMPNSSFFSSLLCGAKFDFAWLLSANFERANLKGVTFNSADVSGSKFSFSNMNMTSFKDANISGVEFKEDYLYKRIMLSFSKKVKIKYIGCRFEGAYGNERFKRLVSDAAYIEEVFRDSPRIYQLWLITSDCGRSLRVWFLWAVITILFFAFIYQLLGISQFHFGTAIHTKESFINFIYFSVVAFTTLGFGDISPITSWAMFWVVFEVFVGFIMLGILISIGANKIARRS